MTEGNSLLFTLFAVLACGGALAVVFSQNVVRMAFWLIVSLASTAGLFFLLNADFVGATQLLIYVGGTLVLLVFGVMLTASGSYQKTPTSSAELFMALGIGVMVFAVVFATVGMVGWDETLMNSPVSRIKVAAGYLEVEQHKGYNPAGEGNTARPIGISLLGLRPDRDLSGKTTTLSPGYLLPFEIVSVHLLVVLVGAAYLARAKRRVVDSKIGS